MWLEIFRLLHDFGLIFGVGGVTIAAIISSKAEKNPELNSAVMKIIPTISNFIWLGLILLIISGIGLMYFITWPMNKGLLLSKHILVVWIVIIGIFIGTRVRKMKRLMPKDKEKQSVEFLRTKKQLKAFSKINLILWYLVTIMSAFV